MFVNIKAYAGGNLIYEVNPYDGDMDGYRRMLLGQSQPKTETKPDQKPKPAAKPIRVDKNALKALRADVRTCEERIDKIAAMLKKIEGRLADPEFYRGPADQIAALQRKRAEALSAQVRAEELWLEAQERLEDGGG